jgi:flagellar motor switch protein FliG
MADALRAADSSTTPAIQVGGEKAAAILLTLLGDAEAAAILATLDPADVRRLGAAMLDVASANAAEIETALEMFVTRGRAVSSLGQNPEGRVRSVMTAALGNVRADNVLASIAPQASLSVLDRLAWMSTAAITAALAAEHPQVSALILACLTPEAAAEALAPLDEEVQADLIYRAASLGSVNPAALADLEQLLDGYAATPQAGPAIRIGGRSEAAKIVTNLKQPTDKRVLRSLKRRDRELAQAIEDDMFVFDDLVSMDAKNMGELLRAVDTQVLTLALRGARQSTIDKMLGCLSARAAQSIRDEIAEAQPVKRAEVDEAQRAVAAVARAMAEDGTLNLGGKNDDYV